MGARGQRIPAQERPLLPAVHADFGHLLLRRDPGYMAAFSKTTEKFISRAQVLSLLLGCRYHPFQQPPGLCPVVEGQQGNTQLLTNQGHAQPLPWSHTPSHISLDSLAVSTHWSCPQVTGCANQSGDLIPEAEGAW